MEAIFLHLQKFKIIESEFGIWMSVTLQPIHRKESLYLYFSNAPPG